VPEAPRSANSPPADAPGPWLEPRRCGPTFSQSGGAGVFRPHRDNHLIARQGRRGSANSPGDCSPEEGRAAPSGLHRSAPYRRNRVAIVARSCQWSATGSGTAGDGAPMATRQCCPVRSSAPRAAVFRAAPALCVARVGQLGPDQPRWPQSFPRQQQSAPAFRRSRFPFAIGLEPMAPQWLTFQRQFQLRGIELFRFRPELCMPVLLNLTFQLLDQPLQFGDEGVLLGHHRLLVLT